MPTLFKAYPEVLLSIFLSLLFLHHILHRRHRGLPPRWPVLGMLPAISSQRHRLHFYGTELLAATGWTFEFRGPWFLGMRALLTCDPANVNYVFNTNFANYPKGTEFAEIFDILGDGIFNSDGESWRIQRKKAHSLMGHQRFRSYVADSTRDKVETGLIPLLSQIAEQKVEVDLQDVFLRLTFDTTCNLVLGIDPGCLAPDFPTVEFAEAMDDAEEVLFVRHIVPKPWWKLMKWLRLGEERKMAKAWVVIDRFIARTIERRKDSKKSAGTDLLTSYIDDQTEELEGKELDKFLRDTTLNLMLAGRDTTGAALTWFFWLLYKNPDVEAKIIEELKANLPKNSMDVGNLVYLHAALLECLRLYPPVVVEHKGVVQPDVLPSGHTVRPGMHLLFHVFSMGRMEGIWGKDCLEFKPERWISEKGKIRHEPSYKFLAFNCGARTCLGKDMALTQMKVVVAAVVSNFHVEVVPGHVVEPKLSIILHMKNGFSVSVRKRETVMKI